MAGHRIRDDISTKSGKLAGRGWGGTEGAKRWQITRRGWGEGGGVEGHGHKDDISTKSGNLGREGLGWHRWCQEVANHSEGRGGGGRGAGAWAHLIFYYRKSAIQHRIANAHE